MAKESYIGELLTDTEKDYIRSFYENEGMREAVKKVLLALLYENGVIKKGKKHDPTYNYALSLVQKPGEFSDTQIASHLKAVWEGICIVDTAFNEMSKYKREEEPSTRINQAR